MGAYRITTPIIGNQLTRRVEFSFIFKYYSASVDIYTNIIREILFFFSLFFCFENNQFDWKSFRVEFRLRHENCNWKTKSICISRSKSPILRLNNKFETNVDHRQSYECNDFCFNLLEVFIFRKMDSVSTLNFKSLFSHEVERGAISAAERFYDFNLFPISPDRECMTPAHIMPNWRRRQLLARRVT